MKRVQSLALMFNLYTTVSFVQGDPGNVPRLAVDWSHNHLAQRYAQPYW